MDIDVIIPVYKPGKELYTLLDRLQQQSVPVRNIILMNTEEKYFAQFVYGSRRMDQYKNVKVFHLSKREFDHGKTRHIGVQKSDADVFIMMTQDAMPVDVVLVEELVNQLNREVAVAYARQLPSKHSSVLEKFTRSYNYPQTSRVKSLEDLPELGIKTYFCSNVCAAYRRDVYEELGGFIRHTIFNEDMIYAATAMKAGYKIAYAAEARVGHSHDYTNSQQFRRNFDNGVSQADHPEIFRGIASESEGKKMVKEVTAYMKKNRLQKQLPHFYMQCACKYLGFLMGKNYKKLPRKWVLAMTSNKEYWDSRD